MKILSILESIDLLIESPESLGLPKFIGNFIRQGIEYRKAQDYFAKYFKHWEFDNFRDAKNLIKMLAKYHEDLSPEAAKNLGDRMGYSYDVEKYWKKQLGEPRVESWGWKRAARKQAEKIDSVTEFLRWYKKVSKASREHRDLRALKDEYESKMKALYRQFVSEYREIVDALNSGPNAYRELKGLGLDRAKGAALKMKTKIDPSRIMKEFPDGYYWYLLEGQEECELEGELMQHCGDVGRGMVMYSLRDSDDDPHVTMDFEKKRDMINQIRGKQNATPKKKYWKYIGPMVRELSSNMIGFTDHMATDAGEPIAKKFFQYMSELDNVIAISDKPVSKIIKNEVEGLRSSFDSDRANVQFVEIEDGGYRDDEVQMWMAYTFYADEVRDAFDFREGFEETLKENRDRAAEMMGSGGDKSPMSLTKPDYYGWEFFEYDKIIVRGDEIIVIVKVHMGGEAAGAIQDVVACVDDTKKLLSKKAYEMIEEDLIDTIEEILNIY